MSARQAILNAAASLVAEQGVTALGIEQVNRRAGVSKGAFFYHFNTKDEMIHALLDQVSTTFSASVEQKVRDGLRFTDALVGTTMTEVRERSTLISTLIAAVYLDRSLGEVVRKQVEGWTQRMIQEDGLLPERAQLLRLALDGLMISTLIYENKDDEVFWKMVESNLENLARGVVK